MATIDLTKLRQLMADGETLRGAAKILGCSPEGAREALRRAEQAPPAEAPQGDIPDDELEDLPLLTALIRDLETARRKTKKQGKQAQAITYGTKLADLIGRRDRLRGPLADPDLVVMKRADLEDSAAACRQTLHDLLDRVTEEATAEEKKTGRCRTCNQPLVTT